MVCHAIFLRIQVLLIGNKVQNIRQHIDFREPYLAIEAIIKNLMTSLRAVTDLQNPAIKDRHWIELMMATKVTQNEIGLFSVSCG